MKYLLGPAGPSGYSVYEQLADHGLRIGGLESHTQEQQSQLWLLVSIW